MPPLLASAEVRALRGPRPERSAFEHQGVVLESERGRDRTRSSATVFLTGAECPFTCVFCDLWRHTLAGATPPGALPAQLRDARAEIARAAVPVEHIKLYNASNFFEPRAVPECDDAELAALLEPFERITVECHPRLVQSARGRGRCRAFAGALHGSLEVAMGLETAHPRAAAALGKESTPASFATACEVLLAMGVAVRAFVLIGAPFVPESEQVEWTLRSVEIAARAGANVVSLVPRRDGNGALEELARRGELASLTLELVEKSFERALERIEPVYPKTAVLLDTWDLEAVAARSTDSCGPCARLRVERLRRISLSGRSEPAVARCRCGPQHARGDRT